jgi:ribA/ribD-fused uncharacterized protein
MEAAVQPPPSKKQKIGDSPPPPLFFWRENEAFGELSNLFAMSEPLLYENKSYPTSEHLYQSLKFNYSGASSEQLEYAEKIRLAKTPTQAKILASQQVAGGGYAWRTALNPVIELYRAKGVQVRPDWDTVKVNVMRKVLLVKFESDQHCRNVLLSTANRTLVEHTSTDKFWADGGGDGKGKNMLGQCLMEIRDVLRAT